MNQKQAKELHLLFFSFMGTFHQKFLRRFREESEFSPKISKNQAKIVHVLYQMESLTFTELSKMLDVEKGGLTTMVDQLEELGLVIRAPDPDDRRKCGIRLSTAGKIEMERMMKKYAQILVKTFADVEDEDLTDFVTNLKQVVEFMERL